MGNRRGGLRVHGSDDDNSDMMMHAKDLGEATESQGTYHKARSSQQGRGVLDVFQVGMLQDKGKEDPQPAGHEPHHQGS